MVIYSLPDGRRTRPNSRSQDSWISSICVNTEPQKMRSKYDPQMGDDYHCRRSKVNCRCEVFNTPAYAFRVLVYPPQLRVRAISGRCRIILPAAQPNSKILFALPIENPFCSSARIISVT